MIYFSRIDSDKHICFRWCQIDCRGGIVDANIAMITHNIFIEINYIYIYV